MTIRRPYAGMAPEQRRGQRRAALLAATLQIIGTEGFSALSIARLCRATGLNDRYFAENFDSKESLFLALIDQLMIELSATMSSAISSARGGLRDRVQIAATAMIDYLTGDPRHARVVFVEAPACPAVAHRRHEIMDHFVSLLAGWATDYYGAEQDAHDAGLARFTGAALFGTIMEATTAWLDGALPITRDELISYTTDLSVLLIDHAYGPRQHHAAPASHDAGGA